MTVCDKVAQVLRFHTRNKRLPREQATHKSARKLRQWLRDMKRKARGLPGRKPLTPNEISELARIPGWDPQRCVRNKNTTGSRRGKHGCEAQIKAQGTTYYGPSRSTRSEARADYLKLRGDADLDWDTFASTFSGLRSDRPLP